MSKPVVAIVGRPNVGKSTLFNVLAGRQIAIVKDTPGVTRDRIYADCTWLDRDFTLIDTGGIEPDSQDIILSQMREQAQIAIQTADVIIFIVDVRQGLVDADGKVADMLGKSSIINKLLGENRLIVSDIAGTTRDAVDTQVLHNGSPYVFIDTAGLRRKSKIKEDLERYSIIRAVTAIERSDVVVVVIDAKEGQGDHRGSEQMGCHRKK